MTRWAGSTLLTAVVALSAMTAPARAGTYVVRSCKAAAEGGAAAWV
jgi:hypothetical protein